MAEPPPPAAGGARLTSTQPPPTNGNTSHSMGPTSSASPLQKVAETIQGFFRTPMRQINLSDEPGSEPSGITVGTVDVPAAAAAAAATKRSDMSDDEEETSPSPKKPKYADYTTKKSDDNSLMSAEDEQQWAKESDAMMQMAAQNIEDEEKAAEKMSDDAVENNYKWDFECNQDDDNGNVPPPTARTFKWVGYNYEDKKVTCNVLKDILKTLSLGTSGNRRVLFDRARDCSNTDLIHKVDENNFELKRYDGEEESLPRWIILTGEPVPNVDGIDMETGATEGFYAPTNPDNVKMADNRRNFLTKPGEQITRPQFALKPSKPKKRSEGTVQEPPSVRPPPPPPPPPPEEGGPTDEAKKLIGDVRFARPAAYFKTQITDEFIAQQMVGSSNARAVAEGQGANTGFVPFDKREMEKFMGFMMANGIVPRPQLEQWFSDCWLRGNPEMEKLLQRPGPNGTTISATDRLRQIRRFMCFYDTRKDIREETKKNPLFKVQPLLDELNRQARKMWRTGRWVSIDEQTIGFKGRSGLKLRISYKREGDGFQCDALCDNGYTFAFYFRHGDAPNVGHTDLNLSPTARRVIWLVRRMPNVWANVFMDNLFNSRKLFTALYREKQLAHGVTRTHGRGLCPEIIQAVENDVKKADLLRGTTKAARLINSKDCPDLLTISVYDSKPVHIMTNVASQIEWNIKARRRVWSITQQELTTMKFLRLNVIDLYNTHMNSVDVADQLRNNYRPDHWMRQRKWWWSFFLWGLGVATTNAWRIYEEMYDEEAKKIQKTKKRNDLPAKWTHADFIVELINDLMWPAKSKAKVEQLKATAAAGNASVASISSLKSGKSFSSSSTSDLSSRDGVTEYLKKHSQNNISEKRMEDDYFSARLNGKFHASVPSLENSRCQHCYYKWKTLDADAQKEHIQMQQNRTLVRRCLVCNVNLCWLCENEWHGVDMSAYSGGN